jgi:hypothetical protein
MPETLLLWCSVRVQGHLFAVVVTANVAGGVGYDAETQPEPISAIQWEDDKVHRYTFLLTLIWIQAFYHNYSQVQLIQRIEHTSQSCLVTQLAM